MTWLEIIKRAFGIIGTELHLSEIYTRVFDIVDTECPEKRNNKTIESTIRGTLERFSEDSDAFGGEHCFSITRGKGRGYWRRDN